PGLIGGGPSGSSSPSGVLNCNGPTNLTTATDTVTFDAAHLCQISTLTTSETSLTLTDSRGAACTTASRCQDDWLLCQDATGGHTVVVNNSNVVFFNNSSALDYPLAASGSGSPDCQWYYIDFNGSKMIISNESGAFVGP